ncbi:MAG: TatD family hydrolase [Anaerolineae bacterium]
MSRAALVDTHAHLDDQAFAKDLEEVLARARQAHVQAIVLPGLNLRSSSEALALAHRYPGLYAAVGVHPHDARTFTPEVLEDLARLAADPKVVAIGEIGLDFYRNLSPREVQIRVFRELLALARELGRPVIVHDREAHKEVCTALEAHAQEPGFRGGVLHAFSGDLEMAQKVVSWGYAVGIAGPITYPNAHRLRAVARQVPLACLLVETDCPYLPPQPYRGRRNEPAWVADVASAVAQVRHMPVDAVALATSEHARRLFGLLPQEGGLAER